MARILVADKITDEGRTILADGGKHEVVYRPEITAAELLADLKGFEAVVVRSRAQITGPMIEAAPGLKVVGRAGVGLDNVDLETATRCGVIVMNAPEGNTISTAEHTVAMLMSLARQIPAADASMKSGVWDKGTFKGVELRGKTAGVVGFGRIGREVTQRLLAFKMNVLAYDPFVTAEAIAKSGAKAATVDQIVAEADFITVHVPLTEQTQGLFGAEQLAKMKKGVRLVNCARGGIIDEAALAAALHAGKVGGAAIDVFEQEPTPADNPLRKAPNTVLTPHLAASTTEAQLLVVKELAEQIVEVLNGGTVRNAANFPRLAADVLERVRPYLVLGEKLGSFLSQFAGEGVRGLTATFQGRVCDLGDVSPITTALVFGFLKPVSSTRLNYVNARHRLEQTGLTLNEARQTGEASEYTTLVKFEAEMADGSRVSVGGTLSGAKNEARVVKVNGIALDAIPDGNMIVLQNEDVPGVIGKVATCLGENGINIATLNWGRTHRGGEALTVINVDDPVDPSVLAKLRALPMLRFVKSIVVS